jgi:hypothetical protein
VIFRLLWLSDDFYRFSSFLNYFLVFKFFSIIFQFIYFYFKLFNFSIFSKHFTSVTASKQEPFPGWVDNWGGSSLFGVMIAKGVLRNLQMREDYVCDVIPADTVSILG